MTSVKVSQITSKSEDAFMNVREEYGHVLVFTAIYKRETYLLTKGQEVVFVQFDRDSTQEEIRDFMANYEEYAVIKIEENGFVKSE